MANFPVPTFDPATGALPAIVETRIANTLSGPIMDTVESAAGELVPGLVDTYIGTGDAVLGAVNVALGGVRRAGVPLTLSAGAGGNTDSATAKLQRFPFKVAATTNRWRLHGRNFNDRDNVTYTGSLSINGLWFGTAETDASGALTGNMTTNPVSVSPAFTTPASGAEFVTPWVTNPNYQFQAYKEHMLSFGYTGAAQNNHRGIGTVWTSSNPGEAGQRVPAGGLTLNPISATAAGAPVLDLWVEVEVAAEVPVCAYLGDSLTVGTRATYPIRDSYAMKHALANGIIPTFRAAHGSQMTMWTDASQYKWTKYDSTTRPDAVFWALGSNDIFADSTAPTLSELQSRYQAVLSVVRSKVSGNVYLGTILPRNGANTTTEKETRRVEYNDWLFTLPGGARNTFDVAALIESRATPGTVDSRFISSDSIHLTSAGYARMAAGISASLAAANRPPAAPTITIPPLVDLPVTGWQERWRADQINQPQGSTLPIWDGVAGTTLYTSAEGWTAPTVAAGTGGRKVVRFNGVSDGMQSSISRTQPSTVVILGRMRSITAGANNIILGGGASTPYRGSMFVGSTGLLQANAGQTLNMTTPVVDTNVHVFTTVFNGSTSVLAIDGTEATGSTGTESSNVFFLGRWGAGNGAAIDVEEVVVYGRALTAGERASLVSALTPA